MQTDFLDQEEAKQQKPSCDAVTKRNMSDSPSFQLKGGLVPLTILELYQYEYQSFVQQMAQKVEQAPDFFQQTPVVVALEKLVDKQCYIDFIELCDVCKEFGIVPIAIRGGADHLEMAADIAGLAQMPAQVERKKSNRTVSESSSGAGTQVETTNTHQESASAHAVDSGLLEESLPSKVIRQPIRSGQQIYAKGADLIVLAPVSAGAEVLADGNIHIYAPLRGRALAGVKGNPDAMIFCQSLEAELISIAGQYKVNEDLRKDHWKEAVKMSLRDNQLVVESLI
jgi:septum site-determining protein MinC